MIKIGCCGFPVSKIKYAQTFSVVELQHTFYNPPEPQLARKWRENMPTDFEFTLKAWQLITHPPQSPTYKKLKKPIPKSKENLYGNFRPTAEVFAAWQRIKEIAELLKAKLIIFQSPASFEPNSENKKNIRNFFNQIERNSFLFGWEARGKWSLEEIQEICRELELIDVVDPFIRWPVTQGLKYFRLHGLGGYHYRYQESDLKKLFDLTIKEKEVYVMFNNVHMFEDALKFKEFFKAKI
ncbi:MAG: DUF72 domain-containing protein [Candidatus Aminicenantes bacterium]|nr:DUF72 domain-containing protein [Candidatus Aminicenantes bacterium]